MRTLSDMTPMRYTCGLSCKICQQDITLVEEKKTISRGNLQVGWLMNGFNGKLRKEVSESAFSLTKQNASGLVNFQWMDFTKRVRRFSNFTDATGTGIDVI